MVRPAGIEPAHPVPEGETGYNRVKSPPNVDAHKSLFHLGLQPF